MPTSSQPSHQSVIPSSVAPMTPLSPSIASPQKDQPPSPSSQATPTRFPSEFGQQQQQEQLVPHSKENRRPSHPLGSPNHPTSSANHGGLGQKYVGEQRSETPTRFQLREVTDLMKEATLSGLDRPVPSTWTSTLCPGALFKGEQRSGRNAYEVSVEIKHVDLENSFMCGYLNIKGLTEDNPDLTTFFEAEVIGDRHSFLTRKWAADEDIDRRHWTRFEQFRPFETSFNQDSFHLNHRQSPHVFMRWKEQFLVPDHQVRSLHGASFEGFYYVVLDLQQGTLDGYYYHQNSEWYQHLVLSRVPSNTSSAFQFR